eukprot:3468919-Heterocapsa_arctica.AAC.1
MGPEYDLINSRVQQLLRGWIIAGLVWGFHLGMPCSSFSMARRGRPPPLRSRDCPMGLPNLSEKDQERVRVGNLLLKVSCGFMRLGRRMMIPCTLENPHTSRAWITPA